MQEARLVSCNSALQVQVRERFPPTDEFTTDSEATMADAKGTRKQLIDRLNEDLSREYQAIIAYVIYSQVLKGAEYMNIANELEKHAGEELKHALTISKHIDYLGGMPTASPKPVKQSEKPEEMLRADLKNES